jgi:hypothetical protein
VRRRPAAAALAFTAGLALAWVPAALAGGPLIGWKSGRPYLWPNGGADIPYHPDPGGLGTLTPAEALAFAEEAFDRWEAIPTASATYVNGGLLPEDVDETNFMTYFASPLPDGLNAVVFDETGAIFDLIFGPGAAILGFSGPEWADTANGEIVESLSFFNGRFLLSGSLPEQEFLGVMVHEFGHFSNLSHTVVNGQIGRLEDATGPSPHDTFPPENLFQRIETMYPFKFIGGGDETPHPDDIAAFSTLYPAPGFPESMGSIRGTIYGPDGITPLTGVNVIARNVADPFDDAVSGISGSFADPDATQDPLTGAYVLNGLTPGATYAVYVDRLQSGRFFPEPLTPLPGPEELYNGPDESFDPDVDDPAVFTGVPVMAAAPVEGVDIHFNRLRPGPIPMRNDSAFQLFPLFPFRFCGEEYRSLWVNSNGSLTFGGESLASLESDFDLLSGPPRIAALWDDLNPRRGVVSFDETPNTFTVRYTDVPEWRREGANTFEITLHRSSGQFELIYDGVTAGDGLTGYSCGGRITSGRERETDLTALKETNEGTVNGRNEPVIFEWFSDGDNDLENTRVSFTAPNRFRDLREPNDTIRQATRIRAPFDSASLFTEIGAGGDVDFFRVRAGAGTTLIAETRPGNPLDTVLGLFDARDGTLLAVDDDGGRGSLSRLVHPVARDGLYAVAVSTFPDLDLNGGGASEGRYVLSVRTVDAVLLDLGDDDSVEVPFLSFQFPYQGAAWDTVWLNSNGNLTFGQADPLSFEETVAWLLDGPPRICPLWDDLSPDQGGTVSLERTPDSLTIRFEDVPEFFSPFGNTFSVTLRADGGIVFSYEGTGGNDGIVGVSAGEGAADPGPTDLSEAESLTALGTTYERFGPGDLDLDGQTLIFQAP